jgi:tetratricopeptide (TPR) repeat protein
VPPPDASALEPSVRDAMARARQRLDATLARRSTHAELAEAYGELGMTYHAHDFFGAARAAYDAAARLAPRDARWPYLRGQALRDDARGAEAMAQFEAALAVEPAHAAALHALGRTALEHGDLARAQQAFERLRDTNAAPAAALAGLGKVALARRDPVAAAALLESALKLAPGASRLRQPLAMAQRDAGRKEQAEATLRGYSPQGPEPGVPDPLADQVADKAATAVALVRRGQRHGREGRYDLAAQAFEAAASSNPRDAKTLANLGISLANIGQLGKAQEALSRAVDIEPGDAVSRVSLGLVHDRQGHDAQAAAHYDAALGLDPALHEARLYLADARMRLGDAPAAARLYRDAMAQRPSPRARLSLVFALVKLGQWDAARRELEQGLARDPSDAGMANALVRVLAAAPDPRVRDGARAVALARPLHERTRSPDVAESLAMAYAETGQFDTAAATQQSAIAQFGAARPAPARAHAERMVAAYRAGRPAREPWHADDPAFRPRSPAASVAAAQAGN